MGDQSAWASNRARRRSVPDAKESPSRSRGEDARVSYLNASPCRPSLAGRRWRAARGAIRRPLACRRGRSFLVCVDRHAPQRRSRTRQSADSPIGRCLSGPCCKVIPCATASPCICPGPSSSSTSPSTTRSPNSAPNDDEHAAGVVEDHGTMPRRSALNLFGVTLKGRSQWDRRHSNPVPVSTGQSEHWNAGVQWITR